ncbi:FecR family protein [Bacteroidaceae bacterium HV4-6-C5C]|nr:FecR family protein [Bacteroidaceae bacterium HV4-6-C5C]
MNKKLLYKYFQGIASTEEEKYILNWVEKSDENRALFLKERMLFDIALFSSKPAKKRSTVFSSQIFKWGMRSAAIFIFALLSYFSLKDYQYSRVAQMQTVTVPPGQRAQITLADGTKVWLNSQSTMSYAANFGRNERNVQLDGEAYFEVAKNKKIPFYVHTELNTVKVVGTCFNICAYKGSNEFEATLVEGIVDIYSADGNNKITRLQKDDFFSNNNGKCGKMAMPSHEYLRWKEGLYCFDDVPFSNIMSKLEKYYNVKITVNNPQLLHYNGCTGKFREQDGIEHILRTISKEHPFHFKTNAEKDSIIIY